MAENLGQPQGESPVTPPDGFPPNRILAYGAGVVFLLLLLWVAVRKPDLEANYLIRVILAVSAGAFAAVIPGFLHFAPGKWLRAGGALAVFAMVFWGAPRVQGPVGTAQTFTVPAGTTLAAAVQMLAAGENLVVDSAQCASTALQSLLEPRIVSARDIPAIVENLAYLIPEPRPKITATVDQGRGRLVVVCA